MRSGCIDPYFLDLALAGGEWLASRLCRFTPRERTPGIHWIGGWVDRRTGLDNVEKRTSFTLPGLELRLHRPARSQSLYRLRYPGSCMAAYSDHLERTHIYGFTHRGPEFTP
jgi:hypothetical protein